MSSYKSTEFKAKQFDAIAKNFEEYNKREAILKEYNVEIKQEDILRLVAAVQSLVSETEKQTFTRDDRYS